MEPLTWVECQALELAYWERSAGVCFEDLPNHE